MDSGYSGSPRPGCSLLTGDASQPSLCFMIVGKTALVGAKRAGVIVAPAMRHARRVLYVQHLVVQDVLTEQTPKRGAHQRDCLCRCQKDGHRLGPTSI